MKITIRLRTWRLRSKLKVSEVRQLWKEELHRRLNSKGKHCGVQWRWKTREWVTDRKLLKRIAEAIQRDVDVDLEKKGCNLRCFLDDEINSYLKSGTYKHL